MKLYTLFLLAVLGSAATAIAAISPAQHAMPTSGRNVTVINKNQAFPQFGPLLVEPCVPEDCSGTAG